MKKLFTLFLVLAASVGTIFADAVKIGDLYYNLDEINKTAEVTYDKPSMDASDNMVNYPNLSIIRIPESVNHDNTAYTVTSIKEGAFFACSTVDSVFISKSINTIGGDMGLGFFIPVEGTPADDIYIISKLQAINVDQENPNFTSIDGVLYDKEVKRLIQYPIGKTGAYTVPNTVDSIDFAAGYGSYITELTIPGSVQKFGEVSFMYCHAKKISILEGVEIIPNSISGSVFGPCLFLEQLSLPNSLKSIGNNAFTTCPNLKEIILGTNIEYIGRNAFDLDVNKCDHLTCLSEKVPLCEQNFISLGSLVGNTYQKQDPSLFTVYVLPSSVNAYKADTTWGKFTIKPIEATSADVTEVNVSSTSTTTNISWPQVSGAASYELVIKDKAGNVVCTLTFDAQGQLVSLAFNAPARDNVPQKAQTSGFSFTVTGLEAGAEYNLTITAKNENGQELEKQNISFRTDGAQSIEDIYIDSEKTTKILNDGKVYILRGEKVYTVQGQELK